MNDDSSTPARRDDPYDWEALGRYLAGESSPAEAEEVRRWLAENDDAAHVMKLDEIIRQHAQRTAADVIDVEGALSAVKARRNEATVEPLRASRTTFVTTPTSSWRVPGFAALAAALVIVVAILIWSRQHPSNAGLSIAAQIFRTGTGQRDSIHLSDSSMVVLGPQSELRVPPDFGDRDRLVELRGEGYFDVQHDDARPFVVRAGEAIIRDVGTVFTVRSAGERHTRVVVTEGAVLLQEAADSAGRGVVLHPGDIGVLDGDTAIAHRGMATPDDVAWTRGELAFHGAPLSEVAEALQRWYGVTLRFPDTSTAIRQFSGSFQANSLDNALRQLSLAFRATLDRHGDTVYFKPSGGGPIK